jgi:RimJ/RimL family protein N-acetyltransferase
MPVAPTLETERLTLRPLDNGDIDAVAEIFSPREDMWDVLSIPGMTDDPHEVARKRIADSKVGWRDHGAGFLAITLRDECRVVGYCGFVNPSKALRVAQATLCGLLLAARRPPDAMTRLSLVRRPG